MPPHSHEKRLRVQGPRSSGGCQTCKQRHVKCDENRPQCNRCLKGGRRCEYTRQQGANYKQHVIIYTVSQTPNPFPDLDAFSQRALHHYRVHTAPAITHPFRFELWSTIVFQMSEKYNFVRSALIALSNMYELYQQPPSARLALQQSSIRHYNKAIRDILKVKKNEDSMNAIVVACLMFYALDSLRGSWSNALRHAISGMNMIAERQKSRSQQSDALAEALQEALLMLPHQALELGGLDDARAHRPFIGFERPLPSAFSSAEEAYYHFTVLYNHIQKVMARHQDTAVFDGASGVLDSAEDQHEIKWIQDRVLQWGEAFKPLQESASDMDDERQKDAIIYMSKAYNIIINAYMSMKEDRVLFNESVTSAMSELLCHYNSSQGYVNNKFSLCLSYLPILFRVLTQGAPEERARILDLVRSSHFSGREGAWDVHDAIQIGEWVLALKEQLPGHKVEVLEIDLFDGCRVKYSVVEDPDQTANPSPPAVYEEFVQLNSRFADLNLDPSPAQPPWSLSSPGDTSGRIS